VRAEKRLALEAVLAALELEGKIEKQQG